MIEIVFKASRKVRDNRTISDVLGTVAEEVGELATEISIENGHKNRNPGPDGIVGECVDAIAALTDIIYLKQPDLTEKAFNRLLTKKCRKWVKGKKKS